MNNISNNNLDYSANSPNADITQSSQFAQTGTPVSNTILTGNSVQITCPSDFESLLLKLSSKDEQNRLKFASMLIENSAAELISTYEGMTSEEQQLIIELAVATKALEDAVERYTITDEERAQKQEQKERLCEEKNALELQLDNLQKELDSLDADQVEEKAAIETEIKKVNNAIANVNQQIAGIDNEIQGLNIQLDTIKKEIAVANETVQELQKKYNEIFDVDTQNSAKLLINMLYKYLSSSTNDSEEEKEKSEQSISVFDIIAQSTKNLNELSETIQSKRNELV